MTTLTTPLTAVHEKSGAKMCAFAGYSMPIQYSEGIIAEHEWTRTHAGLFDVSHMGQAILKGPEVPELLSRITPTPFTKTPIGKAKYTVLTNPEGGIIDDFIATRLSDDSFFLVINAGRKGQDIAWITDQINHLQVLEQFTDRALIALQGPDAEAVLQQHTAASLSELGYMSAIATDLKNGLKVFISRLGYTGEDGFEISLPGAEAPAFWESLTADKRVKPVGLGARDSLRLEMGYPLYGHDLDESISPIEAGLSWVVSKSNTDFTGAGRILNERENGPSRIRVGIEITGKGVAREECPIKTTDGEVIGRLTSGGFSPSLKKAIGQGYIDPKFAAAGTPVHVEVRGRNIEAVTHTVDFLPARTKAAKKHAA